MNQEKVADAYLSYYKTKQIEDWWAVEEINNLVAHDADKGWRITSLLINKALSDEALAYVAAGPLEDLLKKQGAAVIDRIEEESRKNDRLRLALSGVWGINPGNPIFERWYALMRKYGFAEGKRTAL